MKTGYDGSHFLKSNTIFVKKQRTSHKSLRCLASCGMVLFQQPCKAASILPSVYASRFAALMGLTHLFGFHGECTHCENKSTTVFNKQEHCGAFLYHYGPHGLKVSLVTISFSWLYTDTLTPTLVCFDNSSAVEMMRSMLSGNASSFT